MSQPPTTPRIEPGGMRELGLVGHYDMLATTLNTLRVQPETPTPGGAR